MRILLLALALLLAPAPAALAHGDGRDHVPLIDELLRVTGASDALAEIGRDAQGHVRARQGELSPALQEALARSMVRHTEPGALRDLMVRGMQRGFDHSRADETLAWFRTPLGQRLVQVEAASNRSEARAAMQAFVAGLQAQPPAPQRVATIQRLDRLTGGTETALGIVSAIARGVARALAPAMPPERRPRPGELERVDAEVRARYRGQIAEALALRMLFTYRDVPDPDLEAYLRFWESPAGRWSAVSLSQAFAGTFGSVMERVGRDLAPHLPPAGPPGRSR